ncbi:trans-aconitate methyltransferase 1 [Vermiconidia calcicola]|uniref:Trans-aconitate methyltransferase 1 n=1 Tax=Vermiconidia calcicola TaxID=1690605 RepID=A0ACC3MX23_9PEZI|nr:trans-aconitate methyltransferase 1 [Vermiconidia calcicola]
MATFAKSTFSAASYAAFRPTYPPALYNTVLAYHRGPKRMCLDLGCGTGIVTREMRSRFERVIGTDPSSGMIKQAREQTSESNVEFHQGSAESTPSGLLPDGSVECIVAGQSAHWFDYAKLWPEMQRLLRTGGTIAFWGYKDPVLVDYPRATEVLNKYTYGPDPETQLGPYWTQPGRRYVQEKLRVVQPPQGSFEDVQRVEYEPACNGARSGEGTGFMEKSLSVGQAKAYYRTFSSFHGWQEAHPEQVARAKGGKGDLIDRMFEEMAEGDAVFGVEEEVVRMEWGSGLVMARRR